MISESLLKELSSYFSSNPILQGVATTEAEVDLIEDKLNIKLDDDFKTFTTTFGGCLIRDYQIYGFRNSDFLGDDTIIDINMQFSGFLENYENSMVIGTDGWGNPVFINDGNKVLMFDHDENKEVVMAESFSAYLEKCLRGESC